MLTRTTKRCADILLFLVLFLPAIGFACRCAGSISPKDAYAKADVVVQAKVIAVAGEADAPGGARAAIRIADAWKKDIREGVTVATATTCGFAFNTGGEYLLYLYEGAGGGDYTTQMCVGNLPVGEAGKSLEWLRRNAEGSTITR